jgi:hypothetical protein
LICLPREIKRALAKSLARSTAPSDRITCSTVGIASGFAAIASALPALVNTTVEGRSR